MVSFKIIFKNIFLFIGYIFNNLIRKIRGKQKITHIKVDKNLSYLSTNSSLNLERFTVKDYLLKIYETEPNRLLFIFNQNDGLKITASILKEKAMRLAQNYLKLGIKRGDRIVTICANTSELLFSYFAAALIGAINVPIDPDQSFYSGYGFEYILNIVEANVLIYFNDETTNENIRKLLPECSNITNPKNFISKKFPFLRHLIAVNRTENQKRLSAAINFENLLEEDLDEKSLEMPLVDSDDILFILFTV